MAFYIAIDRGHGFGLDVIKIVMRDRVVADAGADGDSRVRHRLAAFFQADSEIRDIAVGAKRKYLFDLDTASVGQCELDLLFLPGRQSNAVLGCRDLIIAVVYERVNRLIICQKPERYLTRAA